MFFQDIELMGKLIFPTFLLKKYSSIDKNEVEHK